MSVPQSCMWLAGKENTAYFKVLKDVDEVCTRDEYSQYGVTERDQ